MLTTSVPDSIKSESSINGLWITFKEEAGSTVDVFLVRKLIDKLSNIIEAHRQFGSDPRTDEEVAATYEGA